MAKLPVASVAVHVTGVVTPLVKVNPDEGLHETTGDESTMSVTAGSLHDTCALDVVLSGGHVTIGAWVSKKIKLTLQYVQRKEWPAL